MHVVYMEILARSPCSLSHSERSVVQLPYGTMAQWNPWAAAHCSSYIIARLSLFGLRLHIAEGIVIHK